MSDFLRPGIKIVIFFALGVALINDLGAIGTAHYYAGQNAKAVARTAVLDYQAFHSLEKSILGAEQAADQAGAELIDYSFTRTEVTVWIRIPPKRTWWLHYFEGLAERTSATAKVSASLI